MSVRNPGRFRRWWRKNHWRYTWADCRICEGTGYWADYLCKECGGVGGCFVFGLGFNMCMLGNYYCSSYRKARPRSEFVSKYEEYAGWFYNIRMNNNKYTLS